MKKEFSPIPFHEVKQKFVDSTVFEADEEILQRCLAGVAFTVNNAGDHHESDQMSETIRHLLFMKQTQKIQNESSFIAKIALAIALIAAAGSLLQAFVSILALCQKSQ